MKHVIMVWVICVIDFRSRTEYEKSDMLFSSFRFQLVISGIRCKPDRLHAHYYLYFSTDAYYLYASNKLLALLKIKAHYYPRY